jgi:hypothetical protein
MKGLTSTSLVLITSFLFTTCTNDNTEISIGLNQNIHHDDFEYLVTDYSVEKQIGNGQDSVKANGNFYIIDFKVINNAKRVNHKWNNSIAYIKNESGNVYENNTAAQKMLNKIHAFGWKESYIIPCQTSYEMKFVFDLPADVKNPCLLVRGETYMGDFFDGGKYKRTKVQLF